MGSESHFRVEQLDGWKSRGTMKRDGPPSPLLPSVAGWEWGEGFAPPSRLSTVFLPCSHAPSLQALCIFSLANTEAGQAVINIMGIGVDTIDVVMATQSGRRVALR